MLVPTRVGRRRVREWMSDELFQLLDAVEYDGLTERRRRDLPQIDAPP